MPGALASTETRDSAERGEPGGSNGYGRKRRKYFLDFEKADIREVIKFVNELTGQNFILTDKSRRAKITVMTPQAVTIEEIERAFHAALAFNKLTVAPYGPYLKIAEAAVVVPPELRINGTTEKWVLREAVRGVLPDSLYRREKFAFMAPPAYTDPAKRAAVDRLTSRYLAPEAVQRAGLFSPEAVVQFLGELRPDTDRASQTRGDALLNHLLCMQILHELYIEPSSPASEPPQQG